jgi:hypothetical protein
MILFVRLLLVEMTYDDDDGSGDQFIIDTSAHTVDSALDAVETYGVDDLIVRHLLSYRIAPRKDHSRRGRAGLSGANQGGPAFAAPS